MKSSMKAIASNMVIVALVFLMATNFVQGLETIDLQKQLALLNKPSIKTFQTKYGDVVDCVEIYKQLAFDHSLLKNHSIQMKPTNYTSKQITTSSEMLAKNMRCPKGSVAIKRVQREDLVMMDSLPLATDLSEGHQVASIIMKEKNVGVHGSINVWGVPNLAPNQFTAASIFVASGDGFNTNGVIAGWFVMNPNNTRLYAYWTKDGGKTGCINLQCPGFVQVSKEIALGLVLQPLSTYGGPQYEVELSIEQDSSTGNWWVYYGGRSVGYYPKELFTTLKDGAIWAGWGGEIGGPISEPSPPMGSGHFPEEGFGKSCYIRKINLLGPSRAPIYPDKSKAQKNISKAQCYRALYGGLGTGDTGHFMFFGGPPNCPP